MELHGIFGEYPHCVRLIADKMKDMGGFAPAQIRNLLKKRSLSYSSRNFTKIKADSTKSKIKGGSGSESQEDSDDKVSGGEGSGSSDADNQSSADEGSEGGANN